MNTEQAHAEFETWWNRQPHREQFEDVKGQMRNVWVASRAEMVIEMPKRADSAGCTHVIEACRAAIEAAGAKWRE